MPLLTTWIAQTNPYSLTEGALITYIVTVPCGCELHIKDDHLHPRLSNNCNLPPTVLSLAYLFIQGATIPSEAMMHFSSVSDFPLFPRIFQTRGKFSQFHISP